MATGLALVAAAVGSLRRPALTHSLWLLVLLKLITPPLFTVAIPRPGTDERESTGVDAPTGIAGSAELTGPRLPGLEADRIVELFGPPHTSQPAVLLQPRDAERQEIGGDQETQVGGE